MSLSAPWRRRPPWGRPRRRKCPPRLPRPPRAARGNHGNGGSRDRTPTARAGTRWSPQGTGRLAAVAGVAIAVAVVTVGFSGWRWTQAQGELTRLEQSTVKVVTVTRDVAPGEVIASADLTVASVPKAFAPKDAAKKVSDVAGRQSVTQQTSGTAVSLSSVSGSKKPASITTAVTEGHVAYTVALDSSTGLSPLLAVGDKVDVLASVNDGQVVTTERIADSIRVLALDGNLSGTKSDGYSNVTIEVTEARPSHFRAQAASGSSPFPRRGRRTMLNRDLLKIERDAVRQATGVLTAANDATESNEQRDTRAHELLADIVDSIPEGSRLDDNSFEAVIQAGINDLYYLRHRGAASRYLDLGNHGQRSGRRLGRASGHATKGPR